VPTTGQIDVYLEGGNSGEKTPLGPDGFFEGDVPIIMPYTSAEELRDVFHYQQYQKIAESDWITGETEEKEQEAEQLILNFPTKITDPEWVENNVYQRIEEESGVEIGDFFYEEDYTTQEDLKTRITNSNYNGLWKNIEGLTRGQVSSGHAFIRTAALSAAEKYSAGKNTITTDFNTLDLSHGLGLAITNPTYNENQTDQQRTWGIETDTGEDQPLWGNTKIYPNDDGQIFTETMTGEDGEVAWINLGIQPEPFESLPNSSYNIDIEMHGVEPWEDFVRNPENQRGMKYLDSACIAAYINQEATPNGRLPMFEEATLHVHPDKIEYQLN
jgi:hypothetical protein